MKVKKIMVTLAIISIATCSLVACGNNTYVDYDQFTDPTTTPTQKINPVTGRPIPTPVTAPTSEENNTNTHYTETEPSTTAEPRLSDTCDKVFATGTDTDGNFFELVGNNTEDYLGTDVEIGIIKNNEWSVPLTKDLPVYESHYNFDSDNLFSYIGYGCFINKESGAYKSVAYIHDGTIINGNNGLCNENIGGYFLIPECKTVNKEGKIVHSPTDSSHPTGKTYKVLDLDTMSFTDTGLESVLENRAYPYSEGLIGYMYSPSFGDHSYDWGHGDKSLNGFYDINGNRIIDLSMYEITIDNEYPSMTFIDGKCKFRMKNSNNTPYVLTIDKEGNVLDSIKID